MQKNHPLKEAVYEAEEMGFDNLKSMFVVALLLGGGRVICWDGRGAMRSIVVGVGLKMIFLWHIDCTLTVCSFQRTNLLGRWTFWLTKWGEIFNGLHDIPLLSVWIWRIGLTIWAILFTWRAWWGKKWV